MKPLFEQNGGTYSVVGDYCLPNLTAPVVPEYQLGVWGRRRLDYLKHHRPVLYVNLLTSGKLTEQLKAENQMEWVGKMNNIRACANEIVLGELIYN